MFDTEQIDEETSIHEPRLWRDNGWTARVSRNEDGEGWQVAMIKDGEPEPALVGPWTMGRNKVDPKPLDTAAFNTLVKTANEVLRRHEQQLQAALHRDVTISVGGERIIVNLDIQRDEDDPHAVLSAVGIDGSEIAQKRVEPNFKLSRASAEKWAESGYRR